jgi:hypothetical protein
MHSKAGRFGAFNIAVLNRTRLCREIFLVKTIVFKERRFLGFAALYGTCVPFN